MVIKMLVNVIFLIVIGVFIDLVLSRIWAVIIQYFLNKWD